MRGIENTSGPLGQGHTFAVGAAIAAKFMKARFEEVMNQTIYAYISDGGIQEEISQGAGRIAGALGLDNLIMFYDANDIQLSTETKDVTIEDTAKKYEAWGWKVIKIDGNDADAIRGALNEAKAEAERPTLIIGHTVMGKGARKADGSSYEANCATHGAPLGGDAYVNTIKNLGGNPENPFTVFPEVAELYAKRAAELKSIRNGNLSASKTVTIAKDETTSVDFSEVQSDPVKMGAVNFSVTPKGAVMSIDGVEVDYSTPVSLSYGTHRVKLVANHYQEYSEIINVNSAYVTKIIDMTSSGTSASTAADNTSGYKVSVTAPKGAVLYVNSEYIGTVPCSFDKSSGKKTITLSQNGYNTVSYTISIANTAGDLTYAFPEMISGGTQETTTQVQVPTVTPATTKSSTKQSTKRR